MKIMGNFIETATKKSMYSMHCTLLYSVLFSMHKVAYIAYIIGKYKRFDRASETGLIDFYIWPA